MCSTCRKSIEKFYWQRAMPNAVLCRDCWLSPDTDLDSQAKRDTIAKILKDARQIDRRVAIKAHDSLKGMGVPANVHRRRRSDAPSR